MFKITKQSELDSLVEERLIEMIDTAKSNTEVVQAVDKAIEWNDQKAKRPKISPDTIAIVLGNLLGIVLIINHERLNVISTKALGFVLRGRA